jgi:acyl-CoA synthetase (AMP-forming)/AMP-acid ligase II
MKDFVNLGDLRDSTIPETDPALIDCRRWEHPLALSHGDIDRQADACARALTSSGLARGDRVAILSLNRSEVLIAYFAIMRAGFVAVPTNIKFPRNTVRFIVDDAQIKLALCDATGRDILPESTRIINFDDPGPDGFASFLDPGPFETVVPQRGETAMVLYTSGSTGRPKERPARHASTIFQYESFLIT